MICGKRILITGGAGFIGTHIAGRLADANDVTLFDIDLENCLPYSAISGHQRVRRVRGDVMDAQLVDREVGASDIVLHCASTMGVARVIANALRTIETINVGTRNILEAATRHRDRIQRVVYLSTSEVYGDVLSADERVPASVGVGNDPRLCYASAKLMGEHQVWAYHRDFRIPTTIIRPFNVYGPYRTTSHAVGVFTVHALTGADLVLHGDGSQIRSWCYIDDFCDAVIASAERPEAIGQHFNIGNPIASVSIYELAHRIRELSGSASRITTTTRAVGDINVRVPHPENAKRLLDFSPRYDLTSGLRKTIGWYHEHLADFAHW